IDRFVYTAGDGNDTIKGYESKRDIIDLGKVNYTLARQGTSDVLLTAGSGSILLKGAYGKVLKINDRNGTTKNVKTTGLGWASSSSGASSAKSSSSAYLLEYSAEAYVSEASWSMDSAVDSIRAEKETAVLSPGTTGSVQDSTSLLYADTSGSLDRTGEEWKE
ncbi:MAG: hypothetical protein IKH16_00435, partial [Selenomonadaceae bacterium]|nr:hypothetical protein [Selenomonadaceae bacterium]